MIEKLLNELKRIKKNYNNVKFELGNDVSLFFPELEGGNKPAGNFQDLLNQYTKENASRFNSLGANWANDHQLIIYTVLQERFAMADLIRQANIEVEKARAISSKNQSVVSEIENKWLPVQRLLGEKRDAINKLLENNPGLRGYPELPALVNDFNAVLNGTFAFY